MKEIKKTIMTSYYDIEKQVYKGIRSKPFTRIHGTVDWRKKEILKTQASYVGLEFQVSYNWSVGIGLTVEIIVATRYAAQNPTFPPYIMPTQPLSSPLLPSNPTAEQIRTLTD